MLELAADFALFQPDTNVSFWSAWKSLKMSTDFYLEIGITCPHARPAAKNVGISHLAVA